MTAGRRTPGHPGPGVGTPGLAGGASRPVTTDQLVAEVGVPRETLYEWVAWRLLPRPQVSRTTTTWPPGAIERARFVAEKLATHSLEEVSEMVRQLAAEFETWLMAPPMLSGAFAARGS